MLVRLQMTLIIYYSGKVLANRVTRAVEAADVDVIAKTPAVQAIIEIAEML